jgi:hypothetical protein
MRPYAVDLSNGGTMLKNNSRRHAVTALVAGLAMAASLLVGTTGPAVGYPYTIQVQQSGTKVTKTKYYREYRNDRTVLDSEYDAGRLRVVATPYKISEGMKRYDQWLLSLRISTRDKTGGSALAWANVYVKPTKYGSISDSGATRDKTLGSCTTANLNLNLGFGPISTSADIGDLKGCAKAKLDLTSHSTSTGATGWKLRKLKRLTRVNAELYIQVPRGYEPNFRVTVRTPIDSCTDDPRIPPSQCVPTDYDSAITFVVKGQT